MHCRYLPLPGSLGVPSFPRHLSQVLMRVVTELYWIRSEYQVASRQIARESQIARKLWTTTVRTYLPLTGHSKERGYHCCVGIAIAIVGLIVTVTVSSNGGKYAGLCVLLFGSYISSPLTVAWLAGNTPG